MINVVTSFYNATLIKYKIIENEISKTSEWNSG